MMLDLQGSINTALQTYWGITNPKLIDFMISLDEMDPKWSVPTDDTTGSIIAQVVLENKPDKKTYVAETQDGKCYKVEHTCRMYIYFRPVAYHMDSPNIDDYKTLFNNMKTEIDRILTQYKYSITGVSNAELSKEGWNDKGTVARGYGIKVKTEPIIWVSEETVTAIYYISS
jgi:hypothetical protein